MTGNVLISVEGQTEETFVRDVLRPHVQQYGLWLTPVIVKTRRVPNATDYRGGYVPYSKLKQEVLRLLGDSSAMAVTTMYDLYALPQDFPGGDTVPQTSGATKAAYLEDALCQDIAYPKFRPYLQVHEFEALLFADIEQVNVSLSGGNHELDQLRKIQHAFPSPEEIDDGANTAPSKRIKHLFPDYEKVLNGPQITRRIGLARLRAACSHFDEWVAWLESLTA